MRQALSTARLSTDDPALQREVIDQIGRMLSQLELAKSPPDNAVAMYGLIAEITGNSDPFKGLKKQSNDFALSIRDQVQDSIQAAQDSLQTALRFAACGNIIDYAAQHTFDATTAMADCESQDFLVDDYPGLLAAIRGAEGTKILYLADNCGEIVFDGLLIRELQHRGCAVTLAVRGTPIINDATREDVTACGLEKLCEVIDNGTGCPGTPLEDCSAEFQQAFAGADIILSKGMGNFETLSDSSAPIFFLFMVKCERVALYLREMLQETRPKDVEIGDMIFMQQGNL
jgi:uncharacterized protein with ATP-grasp and redox domains